MYFKYFHDHIKLLLPPELNARLIFPPNVSTYDVCTSLNSLIREWKKSGSDIYFLLVCRPSAPIKKTKIRRSNKTKPKKRKQIGQQRVDVPIKSAVYPPIYNIVYSSSLLSSSPSPIRPSNPTLKNEHNIGSRRKHHTIRHPAPSWSRISMWRLRCKEFNQGR